MAFHDFALGLVAFLSEIIGTISGFGSSTFFVPSALYIESFHFVLALTAILHVLSNSAKLVLFRGSFPLRKCIRLAFASIICTAAGAALTAFVSIDHLKICLGVVLVIVAGGHSFLTFVPSQPASLILTGLSGFFTGLVGTGGAIRAIVLQSMALEKNAFVFVSSFIDFGGDAMRATIYLREGYMNWNQWYYLPLLIVAAILGPWCGKLILSKIQQATFERMVTVLIFISGLALIYEGALNLRV